MSTKVDFQCVFYLEERKRTIFGQRFVRFKKFSKIFEMQATKSKLCFDFDMKC